MFFKDPTPYHSAALAREVGIQLPSWFSQMRQRHYDQTHESFEQAVDDLIAADNDFSK
jgi:hypothetical protein